jgi:hypothetical protein
LEIDLTRVPRGELAARALVEALAQTDDRAERHFLEIKSAIDLMSKEGIAKVAKFILGAANRMPEVAARYVEGHAVMVLGVGSGSTPGIEPVEALDIERGVRPYLSVNGPRWDLQRVPVDDGREILLVIVDPPKIGQPAFPCFKDGPGLNNGQIIVRGDGETRQATGEEVLLLQQRGRVERPDVDLTVAIEGAAVAYRCDESVLEDHIESETSRLNSGPESLSGHEPLCHRVDQLAGRHGTARGRPNRRRLSAADRGLGDGLSGGLDVSDGRPRSGDFLADHGHDYEPRASLP